MRTYPHHLTTDLPELPVPRLDESLERYRTSSAALYGPEGEADVNQAIADLMMGHAPALQQTLEEYAATMTEAGSNWLAEQWMERYLTNREPLQLTTNVTYQLNLSTAATGVDRIVELLQRIGSIHILQAKRATPAELDVQGRRMSMDGWAEFNGGIRTPAIDEDLWMRAGTGPTYRTIGLLYQGRMWEVPLTGSAGKLLEASQLRASVEKVLHQTAPAHQNFAAFSSIGSELLSLEAPWAAEENRSMYNRLVNMLFTLTLDPESSDELQTLKRWAFHPGYAWVYKPISYLVALESDLVAAHVEHSVMEAGTLATAVARMQAVDCEALDAQYDAYATKPHELVWHGVENDLVDTEAATQAMYVERVVVRRDENLPFPISFEAGAQLILMIAQLLTYGYIRAQSAVFDMRHFRAGRTEVVRPVTVQAVDFVTALVQGRATEEQFAAALTAHRDWISAANTGKVFDRHLMMLQYIAQELGGADADFFTKHTKARQNFLSTSTLGGADAILRSLLAPADDNGFGVSYAPAQQGIEFIVTWVEGTRQAETFVSKLAPAAELLYNFTEAI
ncbi:choline/carnitine O-acyltransferase [Enteractinococcus coprophilus]|uniref:Carnitine O-acetyltransferase n=1 Tax=Enteractinococcus coprophilus TaxID=1027633 RepID=A0A543AG99_9MICC|nr:choline/carnitine O-acyltransferase [Enteractinococcus coprophilus]TQL71600.1 carnitine O-acetyltransferase [Enteractinococcus coprophilus]